MTRLLKIDEAADRLALSTGAVYRRIREGLIDVTILGDDRRMYRISEDALQRYIDACTKRPAPPPAPAPARRGRVRRVQRAAA